MENDAEDQFQGLNRKVHRALNQRERPSDPLSTRDAAERSEKHRNRVSRRFRGENEFAASRRCCKRKSLPESWNRPYSSTQSRKREAERSASKSGSEKDEMTFPFQPTTRRRKIIPQRLARHSTTLSIYAQSLSNRA